MKHHAGDSPVGLWFMLGGQIFSRAMQRKQRENDKAGSHIFNLIARMGDRYRCDNNRSIQ